MLIPPKYQLTPKISELLASIEASRQVIEAVKIPPEVERNIRRQSTLRSSLFSARIEGNPLTLEELTNTPSKDQKKIEVFNILRALNWITQKRFKDLTAQDLLYLHYCVMEGLSEKENQGRFRQDVGAIFNSAGIAIYLPPRPAQIIPLVARLIKYINSSREQFVPIKASIAHYVFEKIHPFTDGNGRVGRLLMQTVLAKGGYGMKGLVPLEEFLDNHRALYYRSLEVPERDVTDCLEFMLEAISQTAHQAREQVLQKQQSDFTDYLLPRRAEIYNIIKDHKLVNFDTLHRRFAKVNARTLRYDLKKLADQGLIRKLGATKGVYYEISKS